MKQTRFSFWLDRMETQQLIIESYQEAVILAPTEVNIDLLVTAQLKLRGIIDKLTTLMPVPEQFLKVLQA